VINMKPSWEVVANGFWVIAGIYLIFIGIRALVRRTAWASPEGADEREHKGIQAVLLGAVWIVLGLILICMGFGLNIL
jgi:hypothetical protein